MSQTSTIMIENNDGHMWNLEQIIIDIMLAVQNNHDVLIKLNAEGPCAESLGLYKLLDMICASTGYPAERFTIVTWNLIEHHDRYPIQIRAPFKHIAGLQQQLKDTPGTPKTITDRTRHFGNFVVHGSRIRLVIGSYLYTNYKDQTLQTYHCVPSNEYHREYIGLEDILFHQYDYQHFINACKFLTHTPLTFDSVQTYPVLAEKMYGITDAYQDIFVDVVCQTFFTGNTFYMDEKLWRPIITRTPFIVHSGQHFIKYFQQLGFRTFDSWWDEGYSEDPPDYQINGIIANIDRLAKVSHAELASMYDDMQPVLDHNYNRFLELTEHSFIKDYQ